ncbi:long-chain fatty acid transport protein 3 [Podarcis raffonei]|uniref:long-chain fatty acid transport protein 3 n=1 Tax=Podarcis raffonei TaxID=65483 RepID=UPI0023298385|nr:long-chain fatty acid transport protein 3 [Podarcis raffonei]
MESSPQPCALSTDLRARDRLPSAGSALQKEPRRPASRARLPQQPLLWRGPFLPRARTASSSAWPASWPSPRAASTSGRRGRLERGGWRPSFPGPRSGGGAGQRLLRRSALARLLLPPPAALPSSSSSHRRRRAVLPVVSILLRRATMWLTSALALAAAGLLGLLLAVLPGRLRPLALADLAFLVRAWRCRRRLLHGKAGALSLAQRFGRLCRARPQRVFLRFEERSFTYGQAERQSNRVANALLRLPDGQPPLLPGQTVALLVGNEPTFIWAWIGLAKLGVVPAFLGTALRRGALLHCVRTCGARAVLVAHELFEAVEPILPSLEEMGVAVWVLGKGPYPPHVTGLQDLLEKASEEPVPFELSTPDSLSDTCLYIFTSGTTGLPKAARISHLKSIMCLGFYQLVGASRSDVIYVALPLYHMAGSLLGVIGTLGLGATCVLKKKFSASQFWPDCRRHRVTIFQYIGELCRYLVNQPQSPSDREHTLRMAVGSGLRPDVWREFLRRFGNLTIVETYGMTEGSVSLFNYTGAVGAVGRASWLYKKFVPFELVRYDVLRGAPFRDKAGRCQRVKRGEPGLLISPVTPQTPFQGYAGGRELSESKLLHGVFSNRDTYFNTGDLMVRDKRGFVSFWDRTGDTFRWKGENVATTEVGEILGSLDSLLEVTVYGVTVPGHEGRAGMATVVLKPGQEFDGAQVYTHVVELLPPFARPRFLRIQEHLELTDTFKQKKVRLADEGFNPTLISDPLFFLDDAAKSYVPLTHSVWEGIAAGHVRL